MKVHDESNVEEFLKVLEELSSTRVEIGIFGDSGGDILMIASVNEFGCSISVTDKMRNYLHYIGIHLKKDTTTINIPERSFIRSGYDQNKSNIESQGEKLLAKVLSLELSVDAFFNAIGEYSVGLIQEYLTDLRSPANSPATVKLKGSSNPLIDKGQLRSSITFKVVKE